MNDNRKKFILLRIFDQIQQDSPDARDDVNKSVATICNEEGIFFEQVVFLLLLSLSPINYSLVYILIGKLLEQGIHTKSTDNSLGSQTAVICISFLFNFKLSM